MDTSQGAPPAPDQAGVPVANPDPVTSPFALPVAPTMPAAPAVLAPAPPAPPAPSEASTPIPTVPQIEHDDEPRVIGGVCIPFRMISGSPFKPLHKREATLMHWAHYFWLVIFTICYIAIVEWIDTDKDVLAGEVQDVLGEFFPDQAVEHERMSKGEIAPIFAELMNGDDVSKLLNWYQSFCLWKAGSDEHVPFGWNCGINEVVMERNHPPNWDFIKNSPPDAWMHNESKLLQTYFCSEKFIKRHVICGDDPLWVPFGDVDAFRQYIRREVARENNTVVSDSFMFDSTYDEFAILDGYPMLSILGRGAELGISKARRQEKREEAAQQGSAESSLAQNYVRQGKLTSKSLDHMSFRDVIRLMRNERSAPTIQTEHFNKVPNTVLHDTWESLRKKGKDRRSYFIHHPSTARVPPHSHHIRQQRIKDGQSSRSSTDTFLGSSRQASFAQQLKDAAEEAVDEAMSHVIHVKAPAPALIQDAERNSKKHATGNEVKQNTEEGRDLAKLAKSNRKEVQDVQPQANDKKDGERQKSQAGDTREATVDDDITSYYNPIDVSAKNFEIPDWVKGKHFDTEVQVAQLERSIDKDSTESNDDEETHAGLAGQMAWCFNPPSITMGLFREIEDQGMWPEVLGKDDKRWLKKEDTYKVFQSYELKDSDAKFQKMWNEIGKGDEVTIHDLSDYFEHKLDIPRTAWNTQSLRPVCTNHHFGMLHMCGPEYIKVVFHMERLTWDDQPHKEKWRRTFDETMSFANRHAIVDLALEFWQTGMDPAKTGSGSEAGDGATGWYYSQITISTKDFFGKKKVEHVIFSLLTLILFVPIFLIDFIYNLVSLPVTIGKIFSKSQREKVKSKAEVWFLLSGFYDGRGVRYRFLSPVQIMMENIFTMVFIGGIINSCYNATVPSIPPRGQYPTEECKEKYQSLQKDGPFFGSKSYGTQVMLLAPFRYLEFCSEPHFNYLAESLYIWVWDAKVVHGCALLILVVRLLDIFNGFEVTRWLNRTIEVCIAKLSWFMLFFLCVNVGFASAIFVAFGTKFFQFRTWYRSYLVLLLFSFGMGDFAMEGVHTFEDYGSALLTLMMFMYSVLVVAVAMGFFCTIILDAYSNVQDQASYQYALDQDGIDATYFVAKLLYPHVNREKRISIVNDFAFSGVKGS